jgi:hypothetical protein
MPRESFLYELLDPFDNVLGRLDGVRSGGSLDWSTGADVRCSGSIPYHGEIFIREERRVRVCHIQDELTTPLITALVRIPDSDFDNTGMSGQLDLFDKTLILLEDNFGTSYAVAAGTNVISAVVAIIASTGIVKIAVEPSTALLSNGLVWEPNTPKLTIVNDLLAAANYWSVWADGLGVLRSSKYIPPDQRPIRHDFVDNYEGDYLPAFKRTWDRFSTPNRLILVAKSEGDVEGTSATATDEDPESPFSYLSRGRWITQTITDVEHAGNLQELADRKLQEAQQVAETFEVTHPRGDYGLNDLVTFQNRKGITPRRAVIQKQALKLETGGLITSTVRSLIT